MLANQDQGIGQKVQGYRQLFSAPIMNSWLYGSASFSSNILMVPGTEKPGEPAVGRSFGRKRKDLRKQ
jgi:hypothetical protein